MATTTSFKQQCPSCEALVPIRDAGLIGKKIDCPKCKYRFVVEAPEDVADAQDEVEAPKKKGKKRDEDGVAVKSKKKSKVRDEGDEDGGSSETGKKSGKSPMLYVGIGLGVLAVVGLGITGYLVWGGDSGSSSSPKSGSSSGNSSSPRQQAAAAPGNPDPEPEPVKTDSARAIPAGGPAEAMTNLLPNETEGLVSVNVSQLLGTQFGREMFDDLRGGGFSKAAFQQRLGFSPADVDLLLQAWNFSDGWTMTLVHTSAPVSIDVLKSVLHLKPAAQKIKTFEYFVLDKNPWLDFLGRMTFAAMMQTNQVPTRSGPLAFFLYDANTLTFGDERMIKKFLENDCKYSPLSDAGAVKKDEEPPPQQAAGGDQERMRQMLQGGGGGRGNPQAPAAQSNEPQTPPSTLFFTIRPPLKKMMDRLSVKKPVLSLAFDTRLAQRTVQPLSTDKLNLKTIMGDDGILGAAVQWGSRFILTLANDCSGSDDNTERLRRQVEGKFATDLAADLSKALNSRIEVADAEEDNNTAGGASRAPNRGQGVGGKGNMFGGGGIPLPPGSGGGGGGNTQDRMQGQQNQRQPFLGRGGNGANNQEQKPRPDGTVSVGTMDRNVITLTIDLTDNKPNDAFMDRIVKGQIRREKGDLDMSDRQLRIYEVGEAVKRYVDHDAGFPAGTVKRAPPSSRAGRPYPPHERVSWMVDLLPYLGPDQQSLSSKLHRDKSWRDAENLSLASTLIPQFVNPFYPSSTYWVRYPGMNTEVAATHYVGIAGVGIDAAEYIPTDPAIIGKRGIFNYDYPVSLRDVKDGAANTILMAQVPPEFNRGWLAGGGSTVSGVNETDSVRPFVVTQPNGKRGTMVVMADGSVRFISEKVSDEIFKALCTINGGEKVILNRDAPLLPPPEGQTEVKVVETAPAPTSQPLIASRGK